MCTLALLKKRGQWLEDDPAESDELAQSDPLLAQCYAASISGTLLLGPDKGQRVLTFKGADEREGGAKTPSAAYGFDVDAAVRVPAHDRARLRCATMGSSDRTRSCAPRSCREPSPTPAITKPRRQRPGERRGADKMAGDCGANLGRAYEASLGVRCLGVPALSFEDAAHRLGRDALGDPRHPDVGGRGNRTT